MANYKVPSARRACLLHRKYTIPDSLRMLWYLKKRATGNRRQGFKVDGFDRSNYRLRLVGSFVFRSLIARWSFINVFIDLIQTESCNASWVSFNYTANISKLILRPHPSIFRTFRIHRLKFISSLGLNEIRGAGSV